jgi:protein-tyrosine kinase
VPQLLSGGRRRRGRNGAVTSHLITHTDVESSGAEAFRMLRTGLAFANAERPLRAIAVTSPGPSEGKSTVAINLASVLAQAGSRVLLVDADLRHPVLHTVFKHAKKPGFSDLAIMSGDPSQAIFPTGLDGLYCLPCGTIPPSPADLLTLNATRALLERLESEYDYVVIDTPPVLIAADTPIIGALADTSIIVVRAGRTAFDALEDARAAMVNGGAHLSGLVVNEVKRSGRYGRYYYYYYKYHYRYATHTADAAQPNNKKGEWESKAV